MTVTKPTFCSYRAQSLSNSVSYRREQLAKNPNNKLLALHLKQAEKELAEELALQTTDISEFDGMSDDDLLNVLLG
jgi:hypothetical protein